MKTFREYLAEAELNESAITNGILSLVKEIIDTNKKLKDRAEKLNDLYRKETSTSNGVLNSFIDDNIVPSKSNLDKLQDMFKK